MREEQYLTVGANPIIPALTNQAMSTEARKKDNVSDEVARLNRVRDEKFLSPRQRTGIEAPEVELTFSDLIDTVNPLQHIPVVSAMYRSVTGDEISSASRLAGGSLYMGPFGAVAAMVDLGVEAFSGNAIGGHVTRFFQDSTSDAAVAETGTLESAAVGPATPNIFTGGEALPTAAALPPSEAFSFEPTDSDERVEQNTVQVAQAPPENINRAGASESGVAVAPAPALDLRQAPLPEPSQPAAGIITEPLITAEMVARVYGHDVHTLQEEYGATNFQSGYVPALMPEIVSRYHDAYLLKSENKGPLVDIRN